MLHCLTVCRVWRRDHWREQWWYWCRQRHHRQYFPINRSLPREIIQWKRGKMLIASQFHRRDNCLFNENRNSQKQRKSWMTIREGFQKKTRKKSGLLPNPPRKIFVNLIWNESEYKVLNAPRPRQSWYQNLHHPALKRAVMPCVPEKL